MKKLKPLKPLYLFLFYIILGLAQVLVRILYPVRTLGRENLIKDRGFVLAGNHLFAIDPLFVLLARGFSKKMLIMGKQELFGLNPVLDFFWNVAGVFPVRRGTADRSAIEAAVEDVKGGRGLLIFPEGTRSKDGKLGALKTGAFAVAMMAEADIIPCVIWYKGGRPRPFHRITVVFGKPLTQQQLGIEGDYSTKKMRAAKEAYAEALQQMQIDYEGKM
ncbi:MAG: lysophospholipid acyltransferase family protein [Oscillospiraceae bacterium]